MPAPPPPFDLTRAREAFRTAADLHAQATRAGAAALTAGDLERMRAADEAYCRAVGEGRVADAIAADDRFHFVLLEAAGDPDLKVGVELLLPRLRRMDLWVFTRKALDERPSSHPAIIEALERGDADAAAELVAESFLEAGDELAAVVESAGER
jgi:DNA-binding GntR family transcriptional regulator